MPGQHVPDPDPVLLETEYTEPAMQSLQELANQPLPTLPTVDLPSVSLPQVNLPSLTLPGISAEEQKLLSYGMSMIEKMMSGQMPEAYTLGMEKIKSVLAGEYDPTKGDYYKGLKEEAETFKEEGISDIRQAGQLGGMLYSEPRIAEESKLIGQIATGLTKELGRLYESNINREAGMIPQLLGYSGQEINKQGQALSGIGSLSPLAGKSGDINRQQSMLNYQTGIDQALANQQIGAQESMFNVGQQTQQQLINQQIGSQQAMLPYTVSAPLYSELANYGTWSQPTTHYEPGILDYVIPVVAAWVGR